MVEEYNYRAIAGGCLLLKVVDLVILLLEGDRLSCDLLQFGYQANASTTMCTWTITFIIDYITEMEDLSMSMVVLWTCQKPLTW